MNILWWRHSNLAPTLFFLPQKCRHDALLLYRCCRLLDDLVDEWELPITQKKSFLEEARALFKPQKNTSLRTTPSSPTLQELSELLTKFRNRLDQLEIDPILFLPILIGISSDLTPQEFPSFQQLLPYLQGVAVAVGILSIHLFYRGVTPPLEITPTSLAYAHHLGIALQLTNIIRDTLSDAERGYCYLPLEEREHFGVNCSSNFNDLKTCSPKRTHLLRYQAERAFSYFAKAENNWNKLLPKEQKLLLPTRIMHAFYCQLLHQMDHDCFSLAKKSGQLSWFKKIGIVAPLLLF
jgi:15-cis-phytoene synthase